ncbi:MAG TPA: SPOR domain-containing protein [Noviherbaspirillum sp.]|nr:SPOR domain-containing protein [Noviherbaspirillum sp.]
MSLFSFLRKNKQESASDDTAFYSRAEEESKAVRSRSKRRQTSQGSAATDPVLPEKKRARRRLIGAVALVLAAVLGLPMILDSEPKPLADDIVIQIPSKDKQAPLERPAAPEPASSLDAKEEMIDPPAAASAAPAAKTQATSQTTPAAAAVPTQVKPMNMAKPASVAVPADAKANVAAQPVAHTKPETGAVEKGDEAARAKALLEGKPDPKAAKKQSGKFVIQVAALATKEKVDELQSKLKQAGIKSYTQKVATESGDRTRIRVGPFTSKEEAEKVRAKIVKLGLNGSVVPA